MYHYLSGEARWRQAQARSQVGGRGGATPCGLRDALLTGPCAVTPSDPSDGLYIEGTTRCFACLSDLMGYYLKAQSLERGKRFSSLSLQVIGSL